MRGLDVARESWARMWYAPDSATNLAVARVVVAAHALWFVVLRDYGAVSSISPLWRRVPVALQWRFLAFPDNALLEATYTAAAIVALSACMLGLYPRLACLASALLVYHLAPLESIVWGGEPFARGLTFTPLFLVILAAAPSGDALAIHPRPAPPSGRPDPRYGWPRRLMLFLLSQMYLFSAIGKLVDSGPAWASAENMRAWIVALAYPDENVLVRPLAYWMAEHDALLVALGWGTVVFELAFVSAVFSHRARVVLVPAAALFHMGIAATLGIHVGEAWLLVLFVDWAAVLTRLRSGLPDVGPPTTARGG